MSQSAAAATRASGWLGQPKGLTILFLTQMWEHWLWLVLYFVIFTFGELHILPTGLGLFARLAPASFRATTVAAWFFAIFTGSLTAGLVGTLWSSLAHATFFTVLAGFAAAAALMLLILSKWEAPA